MTDGRAASARYYNTYKHARHSVRLLSAQRLLAQFREDVRDNPREPPVFVCNSRQKTELALECRARSAKEAPAQRPDRFSADLVHPRRQLKEHRGTAAREALETVETVPLRNLFASGGPCTGHQV